MYVIVGMWTQVLSCCVSVCCPTRVSWQTLHCHTSIPAAHRQHWHVKWICLSDTMQSWSSNCSVKVFFVLILFHLTGSCYDVIIVSYQLSSNARILVGDSNVLQLIVWVTTWITVGGNALILIIKLLLWVGLELRRVILCVWTTLYPKKAVPPK